MKSRDQSKAALRQAQEDMKRAFKNLVNQVLRAAIVFGIGVAAVWAIERYL